MYETNPQGQVPEYQISHENRFVWSEGKWYPVFGIGEKLSKIYFDGSTKDLTRLEKRRLKTWDGMSECEQLRMLSDISRQLAEK